MVEYIPGDPFSPVCLTMSKRYDDLHDFVSTLGHEMVHVHQIRIGDKSASHNAVFFSFRDKFKELGLHLGYY